MRYGGGPIWKEGAPGFDIFQILEALRSGGSFHGGGMVPGSGNQLAIVHGGEGVLTPQGVQSIGGPAGVAAANAQIMPASGGRSSTTIELNVYPQFATEAEGIQFGRKIAGWIQAGGYG
jgi:hypothetical protein